MNEQVISVSLPSSTLYVSGTVNGVAVTWTNTEGNTWETVAERDPADVYKVALTIIDANGNSSTTTTILYYGLGGLITDRTAADVYRWQTLRDKGWEAMTEDERAEWLSPMKGCYNYTDLNRVESAVEYVQAKLKAAGYELELSTKTDWTMTDIPTSADMERYINNVAVIRKMIPAFSTTPNAPVPSSGITHVCANNLEQILLDIGLLATSIPQNWIQAGEIFSGEA